MAWFAEPRLPGSTVLENGTIESEFNALTPNGCQPNKLSTKLHVVLTSIQRSWDSLLFVLALPSQGVSDLPHCEVRPYRNLAQAAHNENLSDTSHQVQTDSRVVVTLPNCLVGIRISLRLS